MPAWMEFAFEYARFESVRPLSFPPPRPAHPRLEVLIGRRGPPCSKERERERGEEETLHRQWRPPLVPALNFFLPDGERRQSRVVDTSHEGDARRPLEMERTSCPSPMLFRGCFADLLSVWNTTRDPTWLRDSARAASIPHRMLLHRSTRFRFQWSHAEDTKTWDDVETKK